VIEGHQVLPFGNGEGGGVIFPWWATGWVEAMACIAAQKDSAAGDLMIFPSGRR